MESSHVAALQAKHEGLEQRIRDEMGRPAPDSTMIEALKKQKLRIKEALSFNFVRIPNVFGRGPGLRRDPHGRSAEAALRPAFPNPGIYDRRKRCPPLPPPARS
jgi:hypothetical protein